MANISSNNLTSLYGGNKDTVITTTVVPNVAGTIPSKNLTTLYSGSGAPVTATTPYGNANVERFLNIGTDGGNTVTNIVATGNLTIGNITANGNVTADYFIGNFVGNVTGTANFANYAGNVTVSSQPNITSLGTLTGLSSNGVVDFANAANVNLGSNSNIHISGGAANFALITDGSGNLSWGQVANAIFANTANFANYAGNVTVNAQPNITSLGNLPYLQVSNSANATGVITQLGSNNITFATNFSNIATYQLTTIYHPNASTAYPADRVVRSRGNVTTPTTAVSGDRVSQRQGLAYNGNTNVLSVGETFTSTGGINANANAQYTGGQINWLTGNPSGDPANQGNNSWQNQLVFTNSGSLQINPGTAPNSASLGQAESAIFIQSWGRNTTDPAGVGGINSQKARGNRDGALSVQPGDDLGRWNLFGYNGTNYQTGNGAALVGTVASDYVANSSIIPIDMRIRAVSNTASAKNTYFYGNGTVSLPGDLTTTGNITAGNANLGNLVVANFFSGDGGLLSNINGANVSNVANANFAAYAGNVTVAGQGNITSLGILTGLTSNGVVNFANASNVNIGSNSNLHISGGSANYALITDGAGNLSWGQVANAIFANTANFANFAGNVTVNAQPNITSVGNLVNLTVGGNALIAGNLTVGGNITYINANNLVVEDPIIELGGGPNGTPLVTNDGKDRGTLLHYYTTQPIDAFMGWDNSSNEFAFGSNVTVSSDVVTFNTLGNIRTGNANLGNLVVANYFSGDGSLLSNINGANVSNVANANYAAFAGNVTINAQPNITSLGTLTSLSVTGNSNIGNLNSNGNIVLGNYSASSRMIMNGDNTVQSGLQINNGEFVSYVDNNPTPFGWHPYMIRQYENSNLYIPSNRYYRARGTVASPANVQVGDFVAWNDYRAYSGPTATEVTVGDETWIVKSNDGVGGVVADYTLQSYGNITLQAQSNITLGTSGNVFANVFKANYLYGDGSNISNINGANVSNVATANFAAYAGNVTVNAQPNITSVGTLVSLDVTGNITSGNANLGNLVIANYFSGSGNNLSNIQGSNVTGNVTSAITANFANYAGNVTNSAQPNITSVGTLVSLSVTGNISSGNANLGNLVVANFFSGDGSLLSNINGSNVSNVANANYANFSGNTITLANGTSNVLIPVINGNVNISTNGNANIAQFDTNGALFLYPTTSSINALRINSFGNPISGDVSRIASSRARGNLTTPLSVNGSDRLMRLLAFGHNGAAYQTSSVATFNAQVDASYTANGANIPIGWNLTVNDTNGGVNNQSKNHFFYSNGTVSFANSLSVTGNITSSSNITATSAIQGDRLISNSYITAASYVNANVLNATSYVAVGNSGATAAQIYLTGDKTTSSGLRILNAPFSVVMDGVNPFTGYSPFFFSTFDNANAYVPPSRYFRARGTEASPAAVTTNDSVQVSSYAVRADSGNTYLDVINTGVYITGNDGLGNVTGDYYIQGFNANSNTKILTNNTYANIFTANSINAGSLTISGNSSFGNLQLTKFQETVYAIGSTSGTITPDFNNGSIQSLTLTGSITLNSLANSLAGRSMTLILTQGGSGSYTLTSSMLYAGGYKILSTSVGAKDIICIFYDGTTYWASLTTGYA